MVSIIIPVYNRADLVVRTLQSVLAQTLRPLEVVLVDNNSTDDTLSVLQDFKTKHDAPDFRVTVATEPQPGAARARNLGAKLSHGEWLLFFDSDDTLEPDAVECFFKVAEDSNADIVTGRADRLNLNGTKGKTPFYKDNLLVNNMFHSSICPSNSLLSRLLCERVGWWNAELRAWDDWEFAMRMLLENPAVAFCDDTIKIHIFLQRQSITGTEFSSKAGTWEAAIDAVERALQQAVDLPNRERLLKYIDFRRVALSGAYIGEGRRDLARPLFEKAYNNVRHDRTARWLYPLLRSYIAAGGRGASHIVKRLVK